MQPKPLLYLEYLFGNINTEDFKRKSATQLKGNNSGTKKAKQGLKQHFG